MTRKEEIRQEAHKKYPYEGGTKGTICEFSIPIFIQGAEWADKTMIARFCEWIEEHIENAFVSIDGTMTDINGIELSEVVRKAMQNE